ncbi:fucose-1-phosphate guanylyltransferase [Hypomesus transpacificus]|uniref:fucose-1-phosphate guanylyltransferase n=1 Tax=Hypomesus transpacificus TaxID=137520 RepID=UPI001F079494|nr:fucose-1-phosphate guanylyltransferase [Hypomesus transpacificus]
MNELKSQKLQNATKEKLRKFNSLRGKEVQNGEFWDLVVITSMDEHQKAAYELQITGKLGRKELPLGTQYHVFSDPPGSKIGNGGSTLYSLMQLDEIYGKALGSFRVILIHAGGFSQRLPNASALGKIFTALPLGDPLYQMLELKLAMYVDFPSHMRPGVLVTCADDIELYSIAENENIKFDRPGFTALAHPSPLSIGTTHGVFVLRSNEESEISEMQNKSCLQFLHKPSIDKMRDSGAVCKSHSGCAFTSDSEFVYTDSTYYVDNSTTMALLGLLREIGPLNCEIDAYGDFLQALGPDATIDYTNNTTNVTKRETSLVNIRQTIFHHLRGTPLNVILLNNSKFYHIGTTTEYLFHFTEDLSLRSELGILSSVFSVCPCETYERPTICCVMHSVLDPSCSVSPRSVVEYCRLEADVKVGEGSILSGCWVNSSLSIPKGVFMHSLCVNREGQKGFVTVAFGIEDNLKQSVEAPSYMEKLSLFGVSLGKCLACWSLGNEVLHFSGSMSSCRLWNACLFPVCPDLRTSFKMSLEMVQALLGNSTIKHPSNTRITSMEEALQCKNLEEMLSFREGLYKDIMQKKCN